MPQDRVSSAGGCSARELAGGSATEPPIPPGTATLVASNVRALRHGAQGGRCFVTAAHMESIGGNAGPDNLAVNVKFDPETGEIVAIGNTDVPGASNVSIVVNAYTEEFARLHVDGEPTPEVMATLRASVELFFRLRSARRLLTAAEVIAALRARLSGVVRVAPAVPTSR